ncbi:MAG: Tripartite ATP-independent periplasmic transporter [Smithella sp. PtaU1.Bin162]|nr:MAG: Tripartite ATP-independent periplasmic transporter [Smithella sp. PtaU1.Bin162]
MKVIKILSAGLEKIIKISGIAALVLMVGMIFFNIVSRALFQETFGVTEEWSVWLMIWSVFVYIGLDIKEKAHISVDLIPNKLKGNTKLVLEIFMSLVMIIFGVLFLYACWADVMMAKMTRLSTITSIPVPLWIVKLCMPLGMLLFIFHTIEKMMNDIQGRHGEGKKC